MSRKSLPAAGGSYLRDEKGALKPADKASPKPAQAKETPEQKTPRGPRGKEA